MADSNNFLLDTGILLHYARASQLGHSIEQRYGFTKSNFKPLVCVVTIGEIQAIANRCQWGKQKLDTLQRIINNLVRIDISHEEVINAFAKIRSFQFSIICICAIKLNTFYYRTCFLCPFTNII